MVNSNGLHHISKRKRVHNNLEEYPHPQFWIRFLDKLLVLVAILGPASAIPQVLKIFLNQSAVGVSLFSWTLWLILGVPWLIYGFVHKEKPLVIAYSLWFVMHSAVVAGVLMYG
ncbi:PQ-loop repeat-containing protein [archaeon]|jgi:MtN3 and saliva related transmembrane protein|nr:PQ-loop repeat-containing protein [archaeon]